VKEIAMKASPTDVAFSHRFGRTWSKVRHAEAWHGVFWTLFVVLAGLAVLTACDYVGELPWWVRAVGLGVVGCTSLIMAGRRILLSVHRWSPPRTAAEMEQRFPQLGQRVRTVVQFAGREEAAVVAEGAAPGLVAALDEETEAKARPLDLNVIIPRRRLAVAACLATTAAVVLLGGALVNWEWRLAAGRALLGNRPYTQLAIDPGDAVVDQGQDLTISIELRGRADRQVALYSCSADRADASWSKVELPLEDARSAGPRSVRYEATLGNLREPTEYRVAAECPLGAVESRSYRISVRYPLALETFEVALTPPAYTGLQPSTVEGGDLDVIAGTQASFRIKFDRACSEAFLVFSDPPSAQKQGEPQPTPMRVRLEPQGAEFIVSVRCREDKHYAILATAREGMSLPENSYLLRVRKDQPPHVRFEEPGEALEVHSLAEVLMRIRADDDFGLSKVGILFQVNNQEKQVLVENRLPAAVQEGGEQVPEAAVARPPFPQQAVCEKTLLLEAFGLSPTDAVTYYAFAEDNFPGQAQRTETELRFIDIRSFKRIYKIGGT
jgi:hypothetical protein